MICSPRRRKTTSFLLSPLLQVFAHVFAEEYQQMVDKNEFIRLYSRMGYSFTISLEDMKKRMEPYGERIRRVLSLLACGPLCFLTLSLFLSLSLRLALVPHHGKGRQHVPLGERQVAPARDVQVQAGQ